MTKRNLAIARAGDDSRHETWLSNPAAKNFDLLVAYYGREVGKWRSKADRYDHRPGLKYPWFDAYVRESPWLFEYDAVWLCDDDIEAPTEVVSDLFDIFHDRGLWLAQPSLTADSPTAFPMLRCRNGLLLRHTSYVEAQMPVFSRETLERVKGTFSETVSGWGTDLAWGHLLGRPDKMAVVDATPVHHARELKSGSMYTEVLPALGINPRDEFRRQVAKYGNIPGDTLGQEALDPTHPKTPVRLERQKR